MPIKYIHSLMSGAPVLSGTAGAMAALLDAALVTGFGVKSATIVVAGGIATATIAAPHAFEPMACVLVAGATPSLLNGEQVVATSSSTTITWPTTAPDGAATGTITIKVAPLGWTTAFTGTNLRAYKPSVPEATGCFLRLDDTDALAGRVTGFESMSNIGSGAGRFPSDSQLANGLHWNKSQTADASVRPWVLIGDTSCFYVGIAWDTSYPNAFNWFFFGDIEPMKSGDAYACLLTGHRTAANYSISNASGDCGLTTRNPSTDSGCFFARSYLGVGGSQPAFRVGGNHVGPVADVHSGAAGYGHGLFPNAPDNNLTLCKVNLFTQGSYRGNLPGLRHCSQPLGGFFSHRTSLLGTGDMVGRTLLSVHTAAANNPIGCMFFDATGPWRE